MQRYDDRKADELLPEMAVKPVPSARAGQVGSADKAKRPLPARKPKRKASEHVPERVGRDGPSARAGLVHHADKASAALPARIKSAAMGALPERAGLLVPPVDNGAAQEPVAEKASGRLAAPLLDQLAELQVRRKFYIAATNKQMNAGKALMRRYLGWRSDADEGSRDKVNKAAALIVAAAFNGKGEDVPPDLLVLRAAVKPLNDARDGVEKEMKRLARTAPVYPWAKSVDGFGELGLAVILGEADDLSKYPAKGHLWKRLGLAPFEGKAYSSWRREGGLSAEQWTAAGYSPRRRAEVYAVISEPLFRRQTVTVGPYRAIYDRRRAATAETHPDWTKGHSHADGLRVMTKIFLRDLWAAYRRAEGGVPERVSRGMPGDRRANGNVPERAMAGLPADPIAKAKRKRRAKDDLPERAEVFVPGDRRAIVAVPEGADFELPAETFPAVVNGHGQT